MGKSEVGIARETNIGMKAVIKLVEVYYYTKRCITADNFFTSIDLCLHLWEKGLTYLGTIRSNKIEIPVILVSTRHHEAKINSTTQKPDMIMDYNKYKSYY